MKHIKFMAIAMAVVALMGACKQQKTECPDTTGTVSTDNLYAFDAVDGNGDTVDLATLEGKVVLVVNTATECGFTPQYEELQKLYAAYNGRGLEILDFPCNQFGQQAPAATRKSMPSAPAPTTPPSPRWPKSTSTATPPRPSTSG